MKTKISLLLACLTVMGIAKPMDAEIIKNASLPPASTRVKDLEATLRKSGICKHYPVVVKISNNNTVLIATYGDRKLTDKDAKLLALNLAKVVSNNVTKIAEVKVRLYDPASTKYWKDIVLSLTQIQKGLIPKPEQDKILDSIKIVNNFGLVDGPNLETRIELYKRILKLQHKGLQVQPYLEKLLLIEKAEKDKQNIDSQVSDLNASLTAAESAITKPISSNTDTSQVISSLEQAWQEAKEKEAAALQTLEDIEQEQQTMALPEFMSNLDGQARLENDRVAHQNKVDAALSAWQEARHYTDLTYQELMQDKEQSL